MIPHGILASVAMWLWWPKSSKEWNKFGVVALYLVIFFLVMRYVFGL